MPFISGVCVWERKRESLTIIVVYTFIIFLNMKAVLSFLLIDYVYIYYFLHGNIKAWKLNYTWKNESNNISHSAQSLIKLL